MSLSEYLTKQWKPKSIEWANMSNADFDSVKKGFEDCVKHLEPNYKESHPEVVDQLVYFVMRSDKFKQDLNKGFILLGPTGTGKTLLLQAFRLFMRYVHKKGFSVYTGIEIEKIYRGDKVSLEKLSMSAEYCFFGFDDLGEEHSVVKIYGSEVNVGLETLMDRHKEFMNKGYLTFCTTNLDRDALKIKYGPRIDSRIDEMFNIIPVVGKDHRR
jgi:hypothetical protein